MLSPVRSVTLNPPGEGAENPQRLRVIHRSGPRPLSGEGHGKPRKKSVVLKFWQKLFLVCALRC